MHNIHFIGVGGVGMNGLAQLAALHGLQVSGSDRAYRRSSNSFTFGALEQRNIRLVPQDGSFITNDIDTVIYSTAIEENNPDLRRARELNIQILHRAALLKHLIGEAELIAIAGTAGKTTTTGLLGWIFESLGYNPTVYNGAGILNWRTHLNPGNIRKGSNKLWIIEADESDRSFLTFHPSHTIITNITKDHFELEELNQLFTQFKNQTKQTIIEPPHNIEHLHVKGNHFTYRNTQFHVPLLGRHNLENAFVAIKLCDALEMDLKQVAQAIKTFKGIERRLEKVGTKKGITVYDDYAHNPAKINAALQAASQDSKNLLAYWRPHGFKPLFLCQDELLNIFKKYFATNGKQNNNSLFILPVYYAGGTVNKMITSKSFVKKLQDSGIHATYIPDYKALRKALYQKVTSGDTIIGMGARDPDLPKFANQLINE